MLVCVCMFVSVCVCVCVKWNKVTDSSCSIVLPDGQREAVGDSGCGLGGQTPGDGQPAGGAGLPGVLDA